MNWLVSIILCFFVGLCILIGSLISFKIKNKNKLLDFSIALAFSVLLALAFVDVFPEAFELINTKFNIANSFVIIFILTLFGVFILKYIDKFVPHHEHSGEEQNKILKHIAIVTTLAVGIHNLIEGMALYSAFIVSFKTGLIFSIGISCHNIALGLAITSEFNIGSNNKKTTILLMFSLALATLVGACLMMLFNIIIESNILLGLIMSITLGMILYIVFFELLSLFLRTKNKIISFFGFILGIIIMVFTSLI